MNKKELIKNSGILFLALALGACGSSGGGSTPGQNGDALKLNVTALNTKTVVAAAPKTKLDTMLAFLGSKEAVAAPANACGTGNDGRAFDLLGGNGFVCLTEALLVYEEIELENENSTGVKDEVESGPYLIDMIGISGDGIAGSISLNVPDAKFDKLELKVGDLDDRDNDDSLDDSSSNSGDDYPHTDGNTTPAGISAADMANKSIKITGTAHDGLGGAPTNFTFFSDIEGKLEMPISLVNGEQLVVDGSTLVTFVDLSVGFGKLAFNEITATMDGTFGKTQAGDDETCSTNPNDKAQQLACDSVRNVELYHDDDKSNSFDDNDHSHGKGGFDDAGKKD